MDRLLVDISEMQADPAAHTGDTVLLGNFRVVAREGSDIELWSPFSTVALADGPAELAVGDAVSVRGHFRADGRVDAVEWVVHHGLRRKKAIGLLALLLVLGLAGWDLRRARRARA